MHGSVSLRIINEGIWSWPKLFLVGWFLIMDVSVDTLTKCRSGLKTVEFAEAPSV